MISRKRQHGGFTLIELTVVITIIAVLAGLGVALLPTMASEQAAARGATLLQGWLSVARQRAVRDRAPRGIRFYVTSKNGIQVIEEADYTERPDDYNDPSRTFSTPNSRAVLEFSSGDFKNGQTDPELWTVQPGDLVEVLDSGQWFRISGVDSQELTLSTSLPVTVDEPSSAYRILRGTRVSGEDRLKLPTGIIVDVNNSDLPTASGGVIDILFSTRGEVLQPQDNSNRYVFFVRDSELGVTEGSPSLIVLYSQTGSIVSYPVDTTGSNKSEFYRFIQD